MDFRFLVGRRVGVASIVLAFLTALSPAHAATFAVGDDQPTGVVLADGESLDNSAVISNGGGAGVTNAGSSPGIVNLGTIGGAGSGINIAGNLGTFVNGTTGIVTGGPDALRVVGTLDSFTNAGSMSAGGPGVFISGAVGSFTNEATGTISGGPSAVYLGYTANTFINDGTLTGGSYAVYIADRVETFVNGASGTISGGPGGVYLADSVGTFTNDGSITGAVAVTINSDAGSFTNTGSLAGDLGVMIFADVGGFDNGGTIAATTGPAVWLGDDVDSFANSGDITSSGSYGVYISGATGSFENSGVIDAFGPAVFVGDITTFNNTGTIRSDSYGVVVDKVDSFINSGRILSNGGVVYDGPSGTTYFHNTATGVIETDRACACGDGLRFPNGVLVNEGTIRGMRGIVTAGSQNLAGMIDITNAGTIEGYAGTAIDFGDGGVANRDDFLRLLTGSQIIGAVAFGPGFDTLDLRNYQGSATLDVSSLERILGGAGAVWDDSANSGNVVIIDDTAIKFSSPGNYAQLAGGLSNLIDGARNGALFGGVSSAPLNYAAAPESRAAAAAGEVAGDAGDAANGRLWGTVFGAHSASSATGNSYSDTLGGLVAGAHTALTPGSLLGGVVSIARSNFVTAGNGQTIGSTTGAAGLYGETELSGLTLDYALLAGASAHHSERQVAGLMGTETATADYASWFWSPEVGLAIPVLEQQGASAEAGLRVRYIGGATGAYDETGSSADLSVPQQGINVLEARAELSGKTEVAATGHGPVLLTATAGALAQSNLGGSTLVLVLPGGITVDSVSEGTVVAGVYADIGIEAPLGDSASFLAGLGGELRTGGFRSIAARAGLSGAF